MDPTQYWLIVAFTLGGGLFTVAGAWKDWDFFMENRRARLLVRLLGRQGARIFYGVIGTAFVAGGVVVLLIGRAALS